MLLRHPRPPGHLVYSKESDMLRLQYSSLALRHCVQHTPKHDLLRARANGTVLLTQLQRVRRLAKFMLAAFGLRIR